MRIVISGGGTAGHINPAIAMGNFIKKNDPSSEILYIGSNGNLEKELYGKTGEKYKLYNSKGLSRKNIFSNFDVLITNLKSYKKMKRDIREFNPDIGLSTGGYISALAMTAVKAAKKPYIVHEQNAFPGLSTRMLAKHAKKYALAFMEANNYLKNKERAVLTGNPIRSEFLSIKKDEARKKLGFSQDEKIILCFGGSLGAKRLNEVFIDLAKKIYNDNKYRLIIGTGSRYYSEALKGLNGIELENTKIHIEEYIKNMPEVLSACDLAITRSGAMTTSELSAMNKPCILIPSPNVTADHQAKNADAVVSCGGAVKIAEKDLNINTLTHEIDSILGNKGKLDEMAAAMEKIAVRNADERIYHLLNEVLHPTL